MNTRRIRNEGAGLVALGALVYAGFVQPTCEQIRSFNRGEGYQITQRDTRQELGERHYAEEFNNQSAEGF